MRRFPADREQYRKIIARLAAASRLPAAGPVDPRCPKADEASAGVVQRRRADGEAVAVLWRVCEQMRPWNDPLRDIGSARANASSDNLRCNAFARGRR